MDKKLLQELREAYDRYYEHIKHCSIVRHVLCRWHHYTRIVTILKGWCVWNESKKVSTL